MKAKLAFFIIITLLFSSSSHAIHSHYTLDTIPHVFSKKKSKFTLATLALGYGTSTYLLNEAWYKDYPRSPFHFFNDWGEWEHMDKIGHVYTSQFQSIYAFHLYKWTGLSDQKAIKRAALTSLLFQSTVEVLDGFSSQWGFSLSDFGANILGTTLFAIQQSKWNEQRITLKVSGLVNDYKGKVESSDMSSSITLDERADDLFGNSVPSRLLKDYNSQTYWMSLNLSTLTNYDLPKWLNLAMGYGAQNMYGGYENKWMTGDIEYSVSSTHHPRYHQFYIGPDIDLTRIQTKSKFLKTAFRLLNIFKIPLPAIEINTNGGVSFHPIMF